MNGTTQQKSALNHDEIARLASQLWQAEGSQSGRDQEYWLRAEQQLRAISQQGNKPAKIVPAKRKASTASSQRK
jgi:hypothetical protein